MPDSMSPIHKPAEAAEDESLIDEVRAEAYRLYVDRGCEDGHDIEDWLAAEALVRARTR